MRSGLCPSSLKALISFLQALAFSFWSASAEHLLSPGWHRGTHNVLREKSNIPGTCVYAGNDRKPGAAVIFWDGSV